MALETLLLRPTGFSPVLRLLIPAFSLDTAPPFLPKRLHRNINAPLPLFEPEYQAIWMQFVFSSEDRKRTVLVYGERGPEEKMRNAPNRQYSGQKVHVFGSTL